MKKKHPCPDCRFCQWCPESRCAACLQHHEPGRRKLSMAEQIACYEQINREWEEKKRPKNQD